MAGHIIHVHTTIPAPPEQVWDVITDVAHADQVLRSVSDTEVLTDGAYGVGTAWREKRTLFGHHGPEQLHVVEAEAPVRTVVEAEVGDDVIRTAYRLTPAGPDRHSSHGPMRRLYAATPVPMSSPRWSRSSGASIHAVAGIDRSRVGVGGRSAVWTGVWSSGRSSAGRAALTPGEPTW